MYEDFFVNTQYLSSILDGYLLKKSCAFLLYWVKHWPSIVNKYFFDEILETGIAQFFNFVNIWAAGRDNLRFKTSNVFVANKRISSLNKFFDQFVPVFRKSFLENFELTVGA